MTFTWALKDMPMMEKLYEGENMPPAALVKDGSEIKATDPSDRTGDRRSE